MTDYNQDYDNSQASDPSASLAAENASFAQDNAARMRSLDNQTTADGDDWNNPDQTDVNRENSLNDRNLQKNPAIATKKLVPKAADQYADAERQFDNAGKQFATADQNYTDALTDTREVGNTSIAKQQVKPKRKRRRKQRKQNKVNNNKTETTDQTAAMSAADTKSKSEDEQKGSGQMSEEAKDQAPKTTLKDLNDNVEASLDNITKISNLKDTYKDAPEDPKVLKQIQDTYNKQFDAKETVDAKNAPELLEKLRQTGIQNAQDSVKEKASYLEAHPDVIKDDKLSTSSSETPKPTANEATGNNHSSKPTNEASSTPSSAASSAATAVSQTSGAMAQNTAPTGAASASTPHVTQPMGKNDAGLATPKMETGTIDSATPANAKVEKTAAADKTTVLDDDTSDHNAKTAEDVDAKLNRLEAENKKLRENFKKQERIKKLEMENAQMHGGISPEQLDKQQAQKDRKKDSYASKFKQANEEMRGVSNGKLAVVAATRFGKGALAVTGKVASMAWTGLKATGRFLSRQVDKMSGKMTSNLESSLPDATVKQAHEYDNRNKKDQGMGR